MTQNTFMHSAHVSAARKYRLPLLLLLVICFVFSAAMSARADELWSEAYYRAVDASESLSDAERDAMDENCIEAMRKCRLDFACLSLTPEYHEESTLQEIAEKYYKEWDFGYGDKKDGFFFVFDVKKKEGAIIPFGNAVGMAPDSYLSRVVKTAMGFYGEHGIYGVMYGGTKMLSDYLAALPAKETSAAAETQTDAALQTDAVLQTDAAAQTEAALQNEAAPQTDAALQTEAALQNEAAPQTEAALQTDAAPQTDAALQTDAAAPTIPPPLAVPETNARVGEGSSLPAWYPADPEHFVFYHDDTAPRVVDDADIFTDDEEAAMEARLAEIRGKLDRDIVVYTNKSACGLGHDIMAADFFDFNGYGCGDDYEGTCLYVCMDPEDRGWWTACTGPDTMGLYTEEFANEMDDALYEYMANGDYGAGALDWIENFRTLYIKGAPFAPDWLPDRGETPPARFHDSEALRIVDDSGLLTDEERQKLTAHAKQISDTYGKDVVIHLARQNAGLDPDEYARLFYEYNGYGFGENYDGILLTVFRNMSSSYGTRIYASGTGTEKLTEVNRERITGFVADGMDADKYYDALERYLKQTDHMERTGRVPRSALYWILISLFGALSGGAFGGFSLSGAKRRMAVPKVQENADAYLVSGSLNIQNAGEVFLGSSVSKKYIAPPPRSSGGSRSSSGRSSYRSSYSGSSGRSHSGSGRRF